MQQEHEHYQDSDDRDEKGMVDCNNLTEARRITFSDIREHISGPVISIIFHIFLIALLASIIVIEKPEEEPEKFPHTVLRDIEIPKIKKMEKIPKTENEEVKEEIQIDRPDIEMEQIEIEIKDVVPFKQPLVRDIILRIEGLKPNSDRNNLSHGIPDRTHEEIKIKLDEYNAPDGTEDAVLKGLNWLKEHQNPDGSWGDSDKKNFPAYTGMALLAFLAHGETPISDEFGDTVRKGIQKLIEMVGPEADKVQGGYRHAIAMYALSEAYALTKMPMLKDVVNKGTARIIKGMNSKGSFDYGYKKAGRSDLSVAGWNYQALKAAFSADCKVEGLEEAIKKAVKGLKNTHYDSNREMFCYGAGSGPKPTMTAVGVLSLQLYGEGKSREAKAGLKTLQSKDHFWFSWNHNPKAEKPPAWALYQWYYQTQAIFQGNKGKGGTWNRWNKMFSSELIRRQKEDGRWESPEFENNPAKGGHGEGNLKGLDQPVYATSLCCLMLEVYYRYLPTFNVLKFEVVPEKDGERGTVEDNFELMLKD